jgi:hypothetical protein
MPFKEIIRVLISLENKSPNQFQSPCWFLLEIRSPSRFRVVREIESL